MSARIKPHKVRGRELEEVCELDPEGRIVVHHRTVDTLGKMLKAGTITHEMYDAARDLQADFTLASLDPLRSLPILRVPGTGREPDIPERQLSSAGAQGYAGIGRRLEPGGELHLARGWSAAERARVVDPPGLGWTAGQAGAGPRNFDCGAGDAGGAPRVWRGQAGLLMMSDAVRMHL